MKTETNKATVALPLPGADRAREERILDAKARRHAVAPNDPWTAAFDALDKCACAV